MASLEEGELGMNILERIEEGLENLFEGFFHRSRNKLEPAALARSLLRTMQRQGRRGVENVYVPNFFQVQIAQSEYIELEPLIQSLSEECQRLLARQAQERDYSAVGAFAVEISPNPQLLPGKWEVVTSAFRNETPELSDDNTKRWRPGELTPAFQLRVLAGPDTGTIVTWPGESIAIGRAVGRGLNLTDTNTSREHARILEAPDGFYLKDLGSTNGTFLNGKKIEQEKLVPGDEIRVGESIIVWERVESWNA